MASKLCSSLRPEMAFFVILCLCGFICVQCTGKFEQPVTIVHHHPKLEVERASSPCRRGLLISQRQPRLCPTLHGLAQMLPKRRHASNNQESQRSCWKLESRHPCKYGRMRMLQVPASTGGAAPSKLTAMYIGYRSCGRKLLSPTVPSLQKGRTPIEVGVLGSAISVQNKADHHDYYNTTFYSDPATVKSLWTDLDSLPSEHVITHDMLSESHRRAATVNLTFDFPFYGHPIRNVTVATGGFLFTGYMLHVWLAATQFIAPLMANFETFTSNSSAIKYVDNGTSLIVEWHEVMLQDKPDGGNYTFQAVLHKNGDIVFVYKDLPVPVTEIPDKSHPVKVGISDAYMFDRMIFFVKRKTIYEYHQVNKKSDVIRSNTAIYFTALPTCLSLKTCAECRTAKLGFSCSWCDAVQRCSSGIDRHRQSWLENQCDLEVKPSPVSRKEKSREARTPALLTVLTCRSSCFLWQSLLQDKKDASMCSSSAVSPMPPKPAPTANGERACLGLSVLVVESEATLSNLRLNAEGKIMNKNTKLLLLYIHIWGPMTGRFSLWALLSQNAKHFSSSSCSGSRSLILFVPSEPVASAWGGPVHSRHVDAHLKGAVHWTRRRTGPPSRPRCQETGGAVVTTRETRLGNPCQGEAPFSSLSNLVPSFS
ncbi:unnamed protein product [Ixodes persulcatus]